MASSIKAPNLITGLIVMVLLLISFLGGIYGTIKHRERNKKKRLQSIVKHELATEQARMARENVEREMRMEREAEEKLKREKEGQGGDKGGQDGDVEKCVEGETAGGTATEDVEKVEERKDTVPRSEKAELKGVEKEIDTEIGKVRVTLNGIEIDPETGTEPASTSAINADARAAARTAMHVVELDGKERGASLDMEQGTGSRDSVNGEKGEERTKRRKKSWRGRWSIFGRHELAA